MTVLKSLEQKLNILTGKEGIFDKIIEENRNKIQSRLSALGYSVSSAAEDVFGALIDKTKKEDDALYTMFKKPNFSTTEGCTNVIHTARDLSGNIRGFFLKKDKARELLEKNPPRNILKMLGYESIDALLLEVDLLEVFAALRFAEDPQWLNGTFFSEYHGLAESDFEERNIEVLVLGKEWIERAKKYARHKLHHISHLKELGLIFIIPFEKEYAGATLEVFTLVLHYFHEVDFYSRLFKAYAREPNFTERMISALRGDVLDTPLPDSGILGIRIIQRYLAKDDPNDPRLFEPHANPEAIHWAKGEADIVREGMKSPRSDLEFFRDLDFAGDFFTLRSGAGETFVSFDLIDNVVSLSKQSGIESKYIYHQHEALWNKIFNEYFGGATIEGLILDNLEKGYISFHTAKNP